MSNPTGGYNIDGDGRTVWGPDDHLEDVDGEWHNLTAGVAKPPSVKDARVYVFVQGAEGVVYLDEFRVTLMYE